MAKQTFTTGQVLTAAQMTSLQQTAMGGGAATAKTANYVLVAADAGTTVAMNAAGSTTITVNTGLFAAGDTVFIQNLGAGACTVTAGTATVATAGSLILPQNDAGILYFTATGAAIFYDYIQAGAVSPLTTKGDLYTFSTSDARLAVGADGTTLVANSSLATGLEWQTPAASGGMTLISTTTISGATTTISSIPATYNDLILIIRELTSSDEIYANLRFNSDSNANRHKEYQYSAGDATGSSFDNTFFSLSKSDSSVAQGLWYISIPDYKNTTTWKIMNAYGFTNNETTTTQINQATRIGVYNQTGAISSLQITGFSGTFGGTALLYGVK